jgi:DNA-binding YbaB/EbfC family protein
VLEENMAKQSKRKRMRNARGSGMGNLGMMQQVQQLQQQMVAAQEALADETVTASTGGGVVTVVATGDQQIQSITIEPDILEEADVEMLQDLLLSAVNSALDQSRELAAERLGPLAGGLPF